MMDNKDNGRNRYEPRVREIIKAIKKLRIQDGDTILLRRGTEIAKVEHIDNLVKACEKAGMDKVLVIVVDDFSDLTILNEKAMAQHGWFRADLLRRLAHVKSEAEQEKKEDRKIENENEDGDGE